MSKKLSATLKDDVKKNLGLMSKIKGVSESAIVNIALSEYFIKEELEVKYESINRK